MRILLISSAFSGLTQRFYTELTDAGYDVSVELHLGNEAQLLESVQQFQPDLIVCPYLTRRIPASIYQHVLCLIVHPGIKGDRGPSSLDWAIQQGKTEWGVTLLEAAAEMDSGAIWASRTFPLRRASKSSLFNREVTQAAIECLWEALSYSASSSFQPEPLDYSRAEVKGRLQPQMKQTDRRIDWKKHTTQQILNRINAADGSPGVLDSIHGQAFYLYNAHPEPRLSSKAGEIIAIANQAICRASVDGAVWIGHLKAKLTGSNTLKLPAAMALKDLLVTSPKGWSLFSTSIKYIDIDYWQPGRQWPCQEVWYELHGEAAYLHFAFHNGGMSTEQCRLLLSVYRHIATLPIKAIVLMGGEDCWSNGIHLNHIEAAADPAAESWLNINAIDDLILQIVNTLDKLTIAAVSGNAGAGGAILAIAADQVWVRDGVIFNPHYKNMGELYGSEYWTYLLPKRVGAGMATQLTEQRLPISAKKAWHLGLVDKVLDKQYSIFHAQVQHLVNACLSNRAHFADALLEKSRTRCTDEADKPLAVYRKFELTQMYANFYGNSAYHQARQNFVFKQAPDKTPDNIAPRRQPATVLKPGSLSHFIWQDSYAIGDDEVDSQHKDFFVLAEQLLSSAQYAARLETMNSLYQHVKQHFADEESLMAQANFHGSDSHIRDHNLMLQNLVAMDDKLRHASCQADEIYTFIDNWTQHIVHADMTFNRYLQETRFNPA